MENYCFWKYYSMGSYYEYQATVCCFLEDDYFLLILRKKKSQYDIQRHLTWLSVNKLQK